MADSSTCAAAGTGATTNGSATPAPVSVTGSAGDVDHASAARLDRLLNRDLFFIVGCQKSGTTWLQHLLDGHEAICCRGEAYFGPVLLPALGQALAAYNQRQKMGQEGRFGAEDVRQLFRWSVALMIDRWLGDRDVPCVGEKTPENALCIAPLGAAFPRARFIHMVRDVRDVTVSGWFHNLRRDQARFRSRFADLQAYATYLVKAHWVPYIQAARLFDGAHPGRCLMVRFEDLAADPPAEIRRMLAFLDVDDGPDAVARCEAAGSFQRLSGGRPPGREDRSSFFRKGVVGNWHDHLDAATLATLEHMAGPLMRELGYLATPSSPST